MSKKEQEQRIEKVYQELSRSINEMLDFEIGEHRKYACHYLYKATYTAKDSSSNFDRAKCHAYAEQHLEYIKDEIKIIFDAHETVELEGGCE